MSGIRTPFTELLGIEHPIVSAGMGGGAAGGELAGAGSEAGGLGIVGASWLAPERVRAEVERAREVTAKPVGVNLLLIGNEALIDPVLELEPAVFSTAWPRDDQDSAAVFARAHERGAKVMHMVTTLADAVAAADAGADVVVAQGTEGGGHVGEMGTTVIVRQLVKALAPSVPVLAAGGLADGAGPAAGLALGADGILMGDALHRHGRVRRRDIRQGRGGRERRPRHDRQLGQRHLHRAGLAGSLVSRPAQPVR